MKIKSSETIYLISPHLDDAIFSAGGFISKVSKTNKVILINIFTSPDRSNETLSSKTYLNQVGYQSKIKLFKDRIAEDKKAANFIGIHKIINLGFVDALWREKNKTVLGKVLPELDRVYPTYRYHIIRGKVSKHDQKLVERISEKLKIIIPVENSTIFCPMGFGNHVDHIIAREAAKCVSKVEKLYYWSDYPYIQKVESQTDFRNKNNFEKVEVKIDQTLKKICCEKYKTQFISTVGTLIIPSKELFYKQKSNVFPLIIEEKYFFVRNFSAEDNQSKYSFAIYKDINNNRYFAKRYVGNKVSREYKFLLNEIAFCELLKEASTDSDCCVTTPEIVYKISSKNEVLVIYKFINGTTISELVVRKKVRLFEQVTSYLKNLKINKKFIKDSRVMNRSKWFWTMIFIYSLVINLIKTSRHKEDLNKVAFIVIKRIYWMLRRNEIALIHRDFNDFNIMLNGSKIVLIDFQLGCFSDPLLERAIILLKYSDKPLMLNAITKTREFRKIIKDKKTLNALLAYWGIMTIYDFTLRDGDSRYAVPSIGNIIKYTKIW